jgi:hypothetical protein
VSDVKGALEAKDAHAQVSHGTHGASALAHAQAVLNAIISLVYDGLCQWLTAAANAWLAVVAASSGPARSSSCQQLSPQPSFTSLTSITEGDLLIVNTPPPSPSLPSASQSSQSSAAAPVAPSSSLALLHVNVTNERIRSIFIDAFARSLGMDGSVMAISAALAAIDPPSMAPASAAASATALSLIACIEQESLTMTTAALSARIASLASKVAAAASSTPSLVLANGNTSIIIKHYLGDVSYSLADIIDSNCMTLSASTQALVAKSANSAIASFLDSALSQV